MQYTSEDIDQNLRAQGMRVTGARRGVYAALVAAADPMSVAEIEASMRNDGLSIDPVTVYRTLDTFERCGLVARVDRPNAEWRYAIRSGPHHHSIVCSECGAASPLEDCELERVESSLKASTGYSNIRHSLQFFGVCPQCQ